MSLFSPNRFSFKTLKLCRDSFLCLFALSVAGQFFVEPALCADKSQISWQNSLAAAGDLARQERKFVLADVYTDWCHWCKKLDKDVFTNSELAAYLQRDFICVKVNAEDPREGNTVAKAYKVNGFPCALVFSPEGRLLGRVGGYCAAKSYMATIQGICGQNTASNPASNSALAGASAMSSGPGAVSNNAGALSNNAGTSSNSAPLGPKTLTSEEQLKELDQLQKQWQQQNQQQSQQQK